MPKPAKLQQQLLDWYAANRRALPWRDAKGRAADPYRVWLSEIMLQQTTVAAVGPYFTKFTRKWPTVKKLAAARLDDVLAAWAGLGYYARARNLHKCAQVVAKEHGGRFPDTREGLLALPGIGPYTAAAICSIAFGKPAAAVDGNVERVVSRYFAIETPLPSSKPLIAQKAEELVAGNTSPADMTQAFMELGATVCTPRNPACGACPWRASCAARKLGVAPDLPRKAAKRKKPVRYGRVYWLCNRKGRFLIHKREEGTGLYAGMYQLPTTAWLERKGEAAKLPAPFARRIGGLAPRGFAVTHSFTHFDLVLEVWGGITNAAAPVRGGVWIGPESIDKYALPSLMKKAIRLCVANRAAGT